MTSLQSENTFDPSHDVEILKIQYTRECSSDLITTVTSQLKYDRNNILC